MAEKIPDLAVEVEVKKDEVEDVLNQVSQHSFIKISSLASVLYCSRLLDARLLQLLVTLFHTAFSPFSTNYHIGQVIE